MEKINIAEILKDCPKGMELDCLMYDNLYFDEIDEDCRYPVGCYTIHNGHRISANFTKFGEFNNYGTAKCVIFPKGKTTWEGFVPPCKFKTGDVLFVDCSDDEDKSYQYIFILNDPEFYGKWHSYCHLDGVGCFCSEETYLTDDEYHPRFATEEEKTKLFDAIKDNGYKWNPETKTLEKLTPNKFDITTLKPFDKVLVRDNNEQFWTCDWFSFHDTKQVYPFACVGHYVSQCIPYEENQHLLGTTDDCDEYFKTWEI